MSTQHHRLLIRAVRRHNAMVTHRKALDEAINKPPAGHEPAALAWLTELAHVALATGELPDATAESLTTALPLTLESLDDGKLEPAIATAWKVAVHNIKLPPIAEAWGQLIQVVLDRLAVWGARLTVWVLLKVIIASTGQQRAEVVASLQRVLRTKIALIAKRLDMNVETLPDGTLAVPVIDDDDAEVVAELPSAVR